jgi:hypothetical protein
MSKRRTQFNISAVAFSVDVYEFILQLSESRRLAAWLAKQVEAELERNGAPSGVASHELLLKELREIKEMVSGCAIRAIPHSEPEDGKAVIQKISSNGIAQSIPETDLDYQF